MEKSKVVGISYMLISSVLYAFFTIIGRYIAESPDYVPAILLAFFRNSFAAITIFFFILFTKELKTIKSMSRKDLLILCIIGAAIFAPFTICYVLGIEFTSASVASLLANMNKVFFIVFAFFLLKDPISKKKILGVSLAMIGAVFIIWNGQLAVTWDMVFIIGCILLIACAALLGLFYTSNKKYVVKYNSIPILLIVFSFSLITLLPLVIPQLPLLLSTSALTIILLIVAGVVCTALPYLFFSESIERLDSYTASAISLTTPLFAMLFAILFLGEAITIFIIIGAAFVIGGNLLILEDTNKEETEKVN